MLAGHAARQGIEDLAVTRFALWLAITAALLLFVAAPFAIGIELGQ